MFVLIIESLPFEVTFGLSISETKIPRMKKKKKKKEGKRSVKNQTYDLFVRGHRGGNF